MTSKGAVPRREFIVTYFTAKVEVTDEKLENLMETGNFGSIFNGDVSGRSISCGSRSELYAISFYLSCYPLNQIITETLEARQALEDVTARHQEIIKLERSIRDLRDMFVEMSLLVERQGDMINNIERQVMQTRDHVETANVVAKKAMKYQSKFRHVSRSRRSHVYFHLFSSCSP